MSLKSLGGWNYRVLRYKDGALGLHEVYYTDAQPTSCTEDPVGVVGDDLAEMRDVLRAMTIGLDAEILDYEAIVATAAQPKPEGDE